MSAGEAPNTNRVHAPSRWSDALTAARFFAVDPAGLCGIAVRAAPGPVREAWLGYLRGALPPEAPVRRMPAGIADDRLLGGIDLAATLACGRPVIQSGILAEADVGVVLIPMAERLTAGVAMRIAGVIDRGDVAIEREGITRRVATRIGAVALDEGATPEERLPRALAERFAFHIDLDGLGAREIDGEMADARELRAARARMVDVEPAPDDVVAAIVATAVSFGIDSVVAPLLALRAARAAAAIAGRTAITTDDAVVAARLVLAPRAVLRPCDERSVEEPEASDPAEPPQQTESREPSPEDRNQNCSTDLEDVIRAAVQSALPAGLLQTRQDNSTNRTISDPRSGIGKQQMSLLRGRPAGIRLGQLRPGARLALVETLRAAAPWQAVRRAGQTENSGPKRIDVRREDFRIRKFVRERASTVVFCVDASGSTAFHRLAEAKGAVELLLGEAYVARTYAALIAFRGCRADLLLPPSRSLTRAKMLLSTLPGGGGTPLAAGIDAAVLVALAESSKGREPLIVFLTDGRANIARDGRAARPRAMDDACLAAAQLSRQHIATVFVDTSARAREEGPALAKLMRARYVALPRIQASQVRDVVRAAVS